MAGLAAGEPAPGPLWKHTAHPSTVQFQPATSRVSEPEPGGGNSSLEHSRQVCRAGLHHPGHGERSKQTVSEHSLAKGKWRSEDRRLGPSEQRTVEELQRKPNHRFLFVRLFFFQCY